MLLSNNDKCLSSRGLYWFSDISTVEPSKVWQLISSLPTAGGRSDWAAFSALTKLPLLYAAALFDAKYKSKSEVCTPESTSSNSVDLSLLSSNTLKTSGFCKATLLPSFLGLNAVKSLPVKLNHFSSGNGLDLVQQPLSSSFST